MSKAWAFLKESRQTELGEFHPELPSSFGPMTMIRYHPEEEWYDFNISPENRKPALEQPYERLIHEGLKALPVSEGNINWEDEYISNDKNLKLFNLRNKKGNFFYPSGTNVSPTVSTFMKRPVGVRLPINKLRGQFRNQGWAHEPAEAFIEQDIDPKYLVSVPDNWRAYSSVNHRLEDGLGHYIQNIGNIYDVHPNHPFEMNLPKDWGARGE